MEEHIQDATSHQHPNNVRVNVGRRNLGIVQKLLEERWERKTKHCVELLLTKINGILGCLSRWMSDLHLLIEWRHHSKCRSARGIPAH